MIVTGRKNSLTKKAAKHSPEAYTCVNSKRYIHHVVKDDKPVLALNLLLRTYFHAQKEEEAGEVFTHLRKHINKVCETSKGKRWLKKAIKFEKEKSETMVYKLFLDYVEIFGF